MPYQVPRWTSAESLRLTELWPSMLTIEEIAGDMDRSVRAIKRRAKSLGLGKRGRRASVRPTAHMNRVTKANRVPR